MYSHGVPRHPVTLVEILFIYIYKRYLIIIKRATHNTMRAHGATGERLILSPQGREIDSTRAHFMLHFFPYIPIYYHVKVINLDERQEVEKEEENFQS